MTIEELLEMRVGDVLQRSLDGVQILRDGRARQTRIILLAQGADAAKLLAFVTQLTKEPQVC